MQESGKTWVEKLILLLRNYPTAFIKLRSWLSLGDYVNIFFKVNMKTFLVERFFLTSSKSLVNLSSHFFVILNFFMTHQNKWSALFLSFSLSLFLSFSLSLFISFSISLLFCILQVQKTANLIWKKFFYCKNNKGKQFEESNIKYVKIKIRQ